MTPRLFHALSLLLTSAITSSVLAAEPTPTDATPKPPQPASTAVRLEIQRDVIVENGEPGFVIFVSGWAPNAEFAVSAVDKTGAVASIAPAERHLRAPPDGNVSLSIPYGSRELHPGFWIFLVAGVSGIHQIQLMIPVVEAPTPASKSWRIDYEAAAAEDTELVAKKAGGK